MNTNMTGFRWFSKIVVSVVLWMKVVSALEGVNTFENNFGIDQKSEKYLKESCLLVSY